MEKKLYFLLISITLILITAKLTFASLSGYTTSSFARYCSDNSTICNKVNQNEQRGSASCPSENQTISEIYAHAGNLGDGGDAVYQLPDTNFNFSYSNNNNTVNVTSNSHDLSWIGVVCANPTPTPTITPTIAPSLTPTPTLTPTVTVTPTVTPNPTPDPTVTITITPTPTCEGGTCIDIECDGGGDCEVIIGSPTPTATPTATVTPTLTPTITATPTPTIAITLTTTPTQSGPTPTPGESKNDSNNDSNDDTPSVGGNILGAPAPTKAILGTSTMAKTGLFEQNLITLSGLFGILFLAAGAKSYAKEKNK